MLFGGKMRETRTVWAVVAAVVALFSQALLPAASMAAESLGAVQVELCTDQGAKTVVLGADGKVRQGFAGLPCHDCLAASFAVVTTPELAIAPVAYAVAVVRHQASVATVQPRARAPPRPPGQGPPALNV
jgi:hypothetical protein